MPGVIYRVVCVAVIVLAASLVPVNAEGHRRLLTLKSSADDKCPWIGGSWRRDADRLILFIDQDGCDISADQPSSSYDHIITGDWSDDDGYFNYRVRRTFKDNGCTTVMYGRMYKLSSKRMSTEIYGTDGRCDLEADFTEDSIWKRV